MDFKLLSQQADSGSPHVHSPFMLMTDLFAERLDFILTSRLQRDSVEQRFSQYRFMSGGRFLVSLKEVSTEEKILKCHSLLKLSNNYWLAAA